MKLQLIGAAVWGFLTALAQATPGQATNIDERLLGDNAESFAVLRTERDNLGSYYRSRTKVYLDERSKTTGKRLKEVLLADSTTTVDPDQVDPNAPPAVTTEVHQKDESVRLGDLLLRYPPANNERMEAGEQAKFQVKPQRGIVFHERLVVLTEEAIAKDIFGGESQAIPVKLVQASQEGDAIYLKLAKEDDDLGEVEAHWTCVPPALAAQVRAYRTLQPVYLMAGSFEAKEKAIAQAEEWVRIAKEKKSNGFSPEIWSIEEGGATKYLVVQQGPRALAKDEQKAAIEAALGIRFESVKSDSFREWVKVPSVF